MFLIKGTSRTGNRNSHHLNQINAQKVDHPIGSFICYCYIFLGNFIEIKEKIKTN